MGRGYKEREEERAGEETEENKHQHCVIGSDAYSSKAREKQHGAGMGGCTRPL